MVFAAYDPQGADENIPYTAACRGVTYHARANADPAQPCATTIIDGTLAGHELRWSAQSSVCVVMASGGYPGSYEKGKVITGIEDADALPPLTRRN